MRAWSLYLLVLVLTTLTVYGGVIAHPATRVFADNDDSSLFVWWFAHAADVVVSWAGRLGGVVWEPAGEWGSGELNPLYSTSMNHPAGVNGAWNTSVLGLALPMTPVTLVAGPVVAYNLTIMAAPVVSALAAALLARQFVRRPAAFLAGFAYGFSTYVVSQSSGHLNLAWAVMPPLVGLAVVRWLRARDRTAVIGTGLWFGIVLGWQFYISTELLAGTFLAACCLGLALLACAWSTVRAAVLRVLPGVLVSVGTALVIGAPLLLAMALAPGAPGRAIRPHGVWNLDLFDPLVPGRYTGLGGGVTPIPRAMDIDPSEIGGYLGAVWVLLALVAVVLCWNDPRYGTVVRVLTVAGVCVSVLALGAPVRAWGQELPSVAPFSLVESLPVLKNVLPMRLVVHVTLVAALLLGIVVELGSRARRRWLRQGSPWAGVLAVALVFPGAVEARPVYVPEFFAADGHSASTYRDMLPAGAHVKVLPVPMAAAAPHVAEAMVWQAVTGMHYTDTGGYFIGGDGEGTVTYSAPDDALDRLLAEYGDTDLPAGTSDAAVEAVAEVREAGVEYVLIADNGWYLSHDAEAIARFVSEAGGKSYHEAGGVFLVPL